MINSPTTNLGAAEVASTNLDVTAVSSSTLGVVKNKNTAVPASKVQVTVY